MALASLNSLCHTTLSHSSRPNHYTLPHCHHQAPISLPLSLSLTVDLSNLLNSHNLLTSSLYLLSLTHPLLSLFWLLCSVCYFVFECVYIHTYIYMCVCVCVCVCVDWVCRKRKRWEKLIFEKYSSPKPVKPHLVHCTALHL